MPTPIGLTVVHYILCGLGMAANGALFTIVLARTPATMKTYGAVLATAAVVDFLTAASGCMTFMKAELSLIYAFTGPCTYFQSSAFCRYLIAITVCGHAFFDYIITICFCFRQFFRLAVLRGTTPSARVTMAALTLAILPNLIDFFLLSNAKFVPSDSLKGELIRFNRTVDPDYIYYTYEDMTDLMSLSSLVLFLIPIVPAYFVIVIVFMKIRATLDAATNMMSTRTKAANIEIIKGLVIQSCLPVFDICSLCCFFAFLVFELPSEIGGYAMALNIELVCLLHPLITLYFVRPYRVAISNCITRSKVSSMDIQSSIVNHKISK